MIKRFIIPLALVFVVSAFGFAETGGSVNPAPGTSTQTNQGQMGNVPANPEGQPQNPTDQAPQVGNSQTQNGQMGNGQTESSQAQKPSQTGNGPAAPQPAE